MTPVLTFGPFRLFPQQRRLENNGKPVRLGGRALDLLIALVDNAGEVVSSSTLLEQVWKGVIVEEGSLRFHIKNLRKALGEGSDAQFIANVSGRGYCFVAKIEREDTQRESALLTEPSIAPRSALPHRGGTTVGRSDNIAAVKALLTKRRLVTIAGPAGIGKTTLALLTAQDLRHPFSDQVLFVDLAPIENPALVISTLASSLGMGVRTAETMDSIVRSLEGRRLLIVLDNCEHLIEAVARLCDRILSDTEHVCFLVTSREPLRIAGESVHRATPLECPPVDKSMTAAKAMSYPAVQLLVDRASASSGNFALDDATAAIAAQICRRLDGIPLAIELAAARIEFLGLAALASGLNDMFALLTLGRRFAIPRHQTLRATLDWGYKLLNPTEQLVLRSISIFRTTFTLESALAVVADSNVAAEDVVEAMASLVSKSLLTADASGRVAQYRLLEVTRLYASEKLKLHDEAADIARKHAEVHLRLVEAAKPIWETDERSHWLQLYGARIDDIRGALDWAFSREGDPDLGCRLVVASAQFWFQLSLILEYREQVERALQALSSHQITPIAECELYIAYGHALWYSESYPATMGPVFSHVLKLLENETDPPPSLRMQALWGLWASHRGVGEYNEALKYAKKYEKLAKTAQEQSFSVLGDRILGLTYHFIGNQPIARKYLERVLRSARQTPTPPNSALQLGPEIATTTLLARILWLQGLPDRAMDMLQNAIGVAQSSDHWYSMYYVVCMSACPLALWTGDLIGARKHLASIMGQALEDRWPKSWQFIVKLREGGDDDKLMAEYLEPRMDFWRIPQILKLASAATIPAPQPEIDVGDAHWSLPEILRVNAKLATRASLIGTATIEETLLTSLDLARQSRTLGWELRTAKCLATFWQEQGARQKARDLLAATCDKFSEGFWTRDFMEATELIGTLE